MEDIQRTYSAFLYRVVVRGGVPRQDCDDVLQQALLSIYQALDTLDPTRNPQALLGRIARAHVGMYFRQHRRDPSTAYAGEDLDRFRDPGANSEEVLLRNEMFRALLEGMPPDRREVFEYRLVEGLSDLETAELLGIPRETVRSRLARAREDIEAAVRRWHARRGALLPLAALLEQLRTELEPEGKGGRDWVQAAPCQPDPRSSPKWSRYAGRLPAFVSGVGAGGLIVWLLMAQAHPVQPPGLVGGSGPRAEDAASAREAATSTPVAVSPGSAAPAASAASQPVPPPPAAASMASTAPRALKALPCRRSTPDVEDPEELLIRAAEAARAHGDPELARAKLEHHAREFPDGRLHQVRDAMLSSLHP